MNKRKWPVVCVSVIVISAAVGVAQQPGTGVNPAPPARPFWAYQGPKSPELGTDGSVVFRLKSSTATSVALSGSWQTGPTPIPLQMTKGDDGIWQVELSGLKPEIWTYNFVLDGVKILDPGNEDVMRDGTRFLSVLTISGASSRLYTLNDVQHGSVHQVWYPSPTLNMAARRMYIYTPAGYETGQQRYPVLYLLHGIGGDEDAWDNMGRSQEILDNMIAAGKAKPMIVVMTNGTWNATAAPGVSQQPDTDFSPGAMHDMLSNSFRISDSIISDVVPFVDRSYRTLPDRGHRAIAGLSMGGAQTLYAALHHLEKFSYVASFSGAFVMFPNVMKTAAVPTGTADGPSVAQELDVSALRADFPALDRSVNQKLRLLYITCGENDGLLEPNKQFMTWLTSQGIHYQELIEPGYAHEWPFWRISLVSLLPKLFK